MRTAPKVALSLLISILLFAGLVVAAYTGLFNILETRFYQPSVIRSMENQLDAVSGALAGWHAKNTEQLTGFMKADAVKRSLLPNQSAQDIFDRSNLAGALLSDLNGLTGIRIIDAGDTTAAQGEDKGTRRIHFSTFKEDILKKDDFQVSYVFYGKNDKDLPITQISVSDGGNPKIVIDATNDRFIYCFPFYDAYSTWRGTAAFYVSARSAVQYLVSQKLIRISDGFDLLSSPDSGIAGIVTGMPATGQKIVTDAILDRWNHGDVTTNRVVSTGRSGWVLISRPINTGGFIGQLASESAFTFSPSVRILFLAISFCTLFLILFLLFNLKQESMVIVRSRIRRFQIHLLEEMVEKNDDVRWEEIKKNLIYRKHDITSALKKSFGHRMNKQHGAEIDAMLDKSWEEILAALGQQEKKQPSGINAEEIRLMLEQVLQNNAISLNLTGVPAGTQTAKPSLRAAAAQKPAPEPVQELEAETPAEAEEIEEIGEAEEVDELEDLEEIGEAEEVEEIAEDAAQGAAKPSIPVETEELEELAESETSFTTAELAESIAETSENLEEVAEIEELAEEPAEKLQETDKSSLDVAPPQPEEVEYLDGEWEPALLEVATEEELENFIEEKVPDTILVYNFEETPGLDSGIRPEITDKDTDIGKLFVVAGPDFTSLDSTDAEDATEVTYIDTLLYSLTNNSGLQLSERPATEFLEVIGEEEPTELLEEEELPVIEDGSIINKDGLYIVSARKEPAQTGFIDPEFQKLVDSVLQ